MADTFDPTDSSRLPTPPYGLRLLSPYQSHGTQPLERSAGELWWGTRRIILHVTQAQHEAPEGADGLLVHSQLRNLELLNATVLARILARDVLARQQGGAFVPESWHGNFVVFGATTFQRPISMELCSPCTYWNGQAWASSFLWRDKKFFTRNPFAVLE